MNPTGKLRGGVMSLRTLGRGFWIGIIASLALHGLLLSTGQLHIPRWSDAPVLDARIEPVEFSAVALPEPEAVNETVAAQARPQPDTSPSVPQPGIPVLQTPSVANDPAPALPQPPADPPPPQPAAETPPPSGEPYAMLTQAAQHIRGLPARIEIVYELNGVLSGRQTHVWQLAGQRYTLESEGEVTGLAGLFVRGKMIQKSQGRIGSLGLMPEQYEMQRLSGKKENLRFDYDANLIESTYGKRTLELPLLTGAQDPLSSIYQLAMAARGDRDGFIVAASAKRVRGYPYRTLGTETLRTALGEMKALHVARAGDSDKKAIHLWLAPDRYFLPVKVSYVDEDGTEWVLEAASIKTQ